MPLINFNATDEQKAEILERAKEAGYVKRGGAPNLSKYVRDAALGALERIDKKNAPGVTLSKGKRGTVVVMPPNGGEDIDPAAATGLPSAPSPQQIASTARLPAKTAERMTKGKKVEIINGVVYADGKPL